MNQEYNAYGARIERGAVEQAADGRYVVRSYDREGVTTPPIEAHHQRLYNAGESVYFFLTDDGDGKIIGPMDGQVETGGGASGFETDETLVLQGGVLRVNTVDEAAQDDIRPITAQGVYNEFAAIHALLKTI